MNQIAIAVACACLSVASVGAFAQDKMKDSMSKDGMMKKEMSMQDCKDHMAMAKKDTMAKDDMKMKMDTECADMMKKHDAMMKKDGAMKK